MTDETLQPSEPMQLAEELQDIKRQLGSLTTRVTQAESRLSSNPELGCILTPADAPSKSASPVPTRAVPLPVAASSVPHASKEDARFTLAYFYGATSLYYKVHNRL